MPETQQKLSPKKDKTKLHRSKKHKKGFVWLQTIEYICILVETEAGIISVGTGSLILK